MLKLFNSSSLSASIRALYLPLLAESSQLLAYGVIAVLLVLMFAAWRGCLAGFDRRINDGKSPRTAIRTFWRNLLLIEAFLCVLVVLAILNPQWFNFAGPEAVGP
jgi:hypothetical protein